MDACNGSSWIVGAAAGDNFGSVMKYDTADILWVAAPGVDDPDLGVGMLYALPSTATNISEAVMTVSGEAIADHLGTQIGLVEDSDMDGYADLWVSAYGADRNGINAGAVYLLTTATMGADVSSAAAIVTGNAAGDYFGWDLWNQDTSMMACTSGFGRVHNGAVTFLTYLPLENSYYSSRCNVHWCTIWRTSWLEF